MWTPSCPRCVWRSSRRRPRDACPWFPCCPSALFAGSWFPSSSWTWASSCQGSMRWDAPVQLTSSSHTDWCTHYLWYRFNTRSVWHLNMFKKFKVILNCSAAASSSSSFHSVLQLFKGIVRSKMNFNSVSTHHDAYIAVGEMFESIKHFWSFRGKQRCSQIQYNWSTWGLLQT